MRTRNRNLFIIFCFIVLIIGCAEQQVVIQSVSDDKVVVKGRPDGFVEAYSMANNECKKDARLTEYITDYSDDLQVVAFNCLEQQTEEIPAAAEEAPAETGEVPAESEEVSSQ